MSRASRLPVTTKITWRLDPPAGVRRHPDTSSKRISRACTLLPFAFGASFVTPPTILWPLAFASATLARLHGVIMASRLGGFVSREPGRSWWIFLDTSRRIHMRRPDLKITPYPFLLGFWRRFS